jgi:hypothetical protein
MKSNEELCKAAIKLFNDYQDLIKKCSENDESVLFKIYEMMNDRSKYTTNESQIIFSKFILLVAGKEIGDKIC